MNHAAMTTCFASLRQLSRVWFATALFALVVAGGCSYPVAEPINMELISSLRTALSARNEEWLKVNADIVEERHASGEMRDDEYAAFKGIIDQARAGQWVEAEKATLKFQRAQRPTREQIDEVRKVRG